MTKASLFIVAVVTVTWHSLAHADLHFVPDDFLSLQEALDESNSNDTIVCRNGTYYGPFFVWARNLTIASEFILTHDYSNVTNCVVRPPRGDRHHRCFFTQSADSTDTELTIIGLTISLAHADGIDENKGGGVYVRNRTAEIRDCIFKSNFAVQGGAVYCDSSIVLLKNCTFLSNDAHQGRFLFARRSRVQLDSCEIGPNGFLDIQSNDDGEVQLDGSSIEMNSCRIHDLGNTAENEVEFFENQNGLSGGFVHLMKCTFENNNLARLISPSTSSIYELKVDSCVIRDNIIAHHFFGAGYQAQLQRVEFTHNRFEFNSFPVSIAGEGLLSFDNTESDFVVEGNTFVGNSRAVYSCLGVRYASSPLHGRVQRNLFLQNRSAGALFGESISVFTYCIQDSVLEYNWFDQNIGFGVYALDWFCPTSYALHNFWGDSTGPYEATRNPGGLGDTTNAATIYDEWLLSEDEIPDTTLYPPPNDADERRRTVPSTWFISSVYPNPFNSEFRIELDGMTGADFEVRLFDLLGREVALLHSGRTLRGTLSFSAPANLAAGIYFVSAHDHSYSETKKVLYLK